MSTQPRQTQVAEAAPGQLIIVCPACQKPTDSLKRLRVMHLWIFLVLFVQARAVDYTSCPACMRQYIAKRTLINIITANLTWPFVLIFNFFPFVRSFSGGPSESIRKAIAGDAAR